MSGKLAPYELRLAERPRDQAEFDDFVTWLLYRSRPGNLYRLPWWASPARRRENRRAWERIVRSFMGRAYELGRWSDQHADWRARREPHERRLRRP